jgi:hypothetical protein
MGNFAKLRGGDIIVAKHDCGNVDLTLASKYRPLLLTIGQN